MKRIFILALALAASFSTPAFSQAVTATLPVTCPPSGVNCVQSQPVVNPDGTLIGSAAPSGSATAANQASQITQETAINAVLGTVTASPTANTVSDRLKAINTTLTALPGTRRVVVSGSFGANKITAYAAAEDVGGLITIPTGMPGGTMFEAGRFFFFATNAQVTTAGNSSVTVFSANPTATTFTDGSAITLNLADRTKVATATTANVVAFPLGAVASWSAALPRTRVDPDGNIYVAVTATTAMLYSNAAALVWSFEATY